MNRTLLQVKVLYDKMGRAEKKIADWVLAHPGDLIPLSICELAERCDCSEATIVRFARRLGCTGYQELKISIARDEGKTNVSDKVKKGDNCFEIYEKVSNDIYCSLEKTKESLDKESLEKAGKAILGAEIVSVYGLGNSAAVAIDAQHKFLRAGCNAFAYSDNHMQAINASHLKKGDVAIGISHSGSSKDVVEALKLAREKGATTICLTNEGKSPILKQSDIVLFTSSNETRHSILGLNSRIAQLAIIDSLYLYLVSHKDDLALKAIEDTERALLSKKY